MVTVGASGPARWGHIWGHLAQGGGGTFGAHTSIPWRLPDYATGPTTGGGLSRCSPGGEIPTAPGHDSPENPGQWLGLPSLLFAAHRHSSPAAQGARRCWGDGLALAAAGGALPWPFRRPRKEIQGRPKSSGSPHLYAPACRSPKRTRENGGQAAPIAPGGWLSWVAMRRGALAAGARDGWLGAPFADGRCCLAVGASLGRHAGQPAGVLPYWRGLRLPYFFPAARLVAVALAVTDLSRVTAGGVSRRVTGGRFWPPRGRLPNFLFRGCK